MPIAWLDLVERDLDDGIRPDDARPAQVLCGRGQEVFGHLGDLLVGEARVRLAHDAEAVPIAHREGVVGEDAVALAVPPLDGGDDHVERAQRPLHLQPLHAPPARPIRRPWVFHHQPLVPALARREELAVECRDEVVTGGVERRLAREAERSLQRQGSQPDVPLRQWEVEKRCPIALEEIEDDERGRQPLAHLPGHVLASEPCLERRERHGAVGLEGQHLRVQHEAAGDRP